MTDSPRIAKLRRKLAGRLKTDGKPQPGFEQNCKDIKAEIARLEALAKGTGS